ncbi:MAG TPA: glycerophosphodiester phosphodiesterase family protein [Candidatus Nanopelagicaceae bacterium]|jgi:glycerophosphoryl diester phosphodiesterase
MATTRPKIYAHRGASVDFPEHTRAAYEGAIHQGADGFECDVRLTKDNVPILWHDPTMERMAGFTGDIAALNFSEIHDRYPQAMLFTDFLELAITFKKDLAIETKHPVPTGRKIESTILDEIQKYESKIVDSGIEISFMSFSWFAIESLSRSQRRNTVMLLDGRKGRFLEHRSSAKTLGPSIEMIKARPEMITNAKNEGKRLFIWTVDQPGDVEFCAANGIDVIITNKPAQARKVLGYS